MSPNTSSGSPGSSFPRTSRVRARADFVRIQRAPDARIRARSFLILVSKREDGATRLGVVASKKVGNAVARNRAKRLLREVFRTHKPSIDGLDLVVIASERLPSLSLEELTAEWLAATAELVKKGRRGLARR